MKKVDYEKALKAFEEYLASYDRSNGSINLKIIHTYEVVKLSEYIAKELKLSNEDIELAKVIALLHDIGRFEQIKTFKMFDDKKLEHAKYGVKVLFEDNKLIRKFIDTDEYDELIYKAIYNHNKLEIESNLTEHELLHAKIVRDSDKIDNFRVRVKDKFEDIFPRIYNKDTINNEIISKEVFDTFISHKSVKVSDRKTILDYWYCVIAFIFDLNFDVSLKYVNEKNYINILIDRIKYQNKDTINKVEILRKEALEYIEKY